MTQMAADHQAQGHQGPDDGQTGLHPHRFKQRIELVRHAAPVVGRAHHQCSKEHKQREASDQLCGGGGEIPAQLDLRHGAARPDVNAEQCKQQTQLQRVDQRHVGQRFGQAVTEDVGQPEPAQHQQRQGRGGIHAVFARILRYRPWPGTRRGHQHQIQARQDRPTQPAPGIVLLGQQQQAVSQLQGQHADQQPATEHMGGTEHPRREHRRQASQRDEMHDEHRYPRQPAEAGRRVIARMPGSEQHYPGRRDQHGAKQPQRWPFQA
ncbi:hypothetical protein D3C71_947330 [compost metagenome]